MLTSKRRRIENICSNLWNEHNLLPKFKIKQLAQDIGLQYKSINLDDNVSGVLLLENENEVITVNKSHSNVRQRFSAAHELGHYFLHNDFQVSISEKKIVHYRDNDSSSGEVKKEIEANYFAACLLMPEQEIQKLVNENISFEENVENLKKKFDVSGPAMAIRLNYLGYN